MLIQYSKHIFLNPLYRYVFTKLNLNKVYGEVVEGNDTMLRIHKYHGWRKVGTYKNHIQKGGKYLDVHIMELLRSEWLNDKKNKVTLYKNGDLHIEDFFE